MHEEDWNRSEVGYRRYALKLKACHVIHISNWYPHPNEKGSGGIFEEYDEEKYCHIIFRMPKDLQKPRSPRQESALNLVHVYLKELADIRIVTLNQVSLLQL